MTLGLYYSKTELTGFGNLPVLFQATVHIGRSN